MNKVVCDVCGTSYPENAAQCPICGFVRTTEKVGIGAQDGSKDSYTYVKGGRFSKANVRKRNQANQSAEQDLNDTATVSGKKSREKSSIGLILIVIVLLLAIVAVVAYIALRFFLPNDFLYKGLDNFTSPTVSQVAEDPNDTQEETPATEAESSTNADVACTGITLSQTQVTLDSIGNTFTLNVTLNPADTTDQLVFESSDSTVVTVDSDGFVTATGEGNAVITVICGSVKAKCNVTCTTATTEAAAEGTQFTFVLNRKEITFDEEGQSWVLYSGNIAASDILWTSDDNTVATISDGKVVAVGNGDTTVYGIYNGQTASCIIHCKLDEDGSVTGTGNISEAGNDTKRTYKLYNPYGNADDVTIQVDEEFTLKLVDEDKNEITNAEWSVDNPECCSYNGGIVKGLKSGTANVTATYEGVTYTCIVRVN